MPTSFRRAKKLRAAPQLDREYELRLSDRGETSTTFTAELTARAKRRA